MRERRAMTDRTCDVAVIGAGTAGLAAERAARKAGATTLLIDEAFAGTVCATVGCMPSKLLIAAAEAAHAVRRATIFGIGPGTPVVDGRAVMRRLQAERDKFAEATRSSFDELPEGTCIKARARFDGPGRLALSDGTGIRARSVVIATGSAPMVPPPFEDLGEVALTNRTVFELEDLPRSLAVVGAGAIGLEIAQAMARLGVETILLDQATTLDGARDPDVQHAMAEVIGGELTLRLGVDVSAARDGDGARVTWTGPEAGEARVDRVLLATGRPPRIDDLGLETTGLALDEHGVPEFDPRTLQCGDAPIFIAGDANADRPILHEASDEGAIAGHNAAAYPDVGPAERSPAFTLTFTDPPHAVLGAPPNDGGHVGGASYEDQGRAKVEARAKGLVRIHAAPDGRLTGAELFAPGAGHMAHLLALAIMRGETASGLLSMPYYHPTLEEGLRPALRDICRATSAPLPSDRDIGNPPGA